MKQLIITNNNNYEDFNNYLEKEKIKKVFIVCTKQLSKLPIYNYLNSKKNIKKTYFNDFEPNPTYESVCLGVKEYNESKCNAIIAIGGGSAIDVAKCIKLYANMDHSKSYLEQEPIENDIKLLAIPTTAGTGSESTKFAVIYYQNKKLSIENDSILPSTVLLDYQNLTTLPLYQRKATMLDALSHAIEGYWSVNATKESRKYSIQALKLIIKNMDSYLNNTEKGNINMLKAANIAGKSINISKTTAGHAMCYKLTSLYNIAHGHAAMLVNSILYPYMISNTDTFTKLHNTLTEISKNISYDNLADSKDYFKDLLKKLNMYNIKINYDDIDVLVSSVNLERLGNFPIKLTKEDIKKIYIELFNTIERENQNESNRFN